MFFSLYHSCKGKTVVQVVVVVDEEEEEEEEEAEEREPANMRFYQFWPVSLVWLDKQMCSLFILEVNGDVRYCHLVLGYTNFVNEPLRGPFRGPFRAPNELKSSKKSPK